MSKRHKWYREICAWADGATIQEQWDYEDWKDWKNVEEPEWDKDVNFRIKPQPKEPQYLYVYKNPSQYYFCKANEAVRCTDTTMPTDYIGKIKLETEE